jgi:hypothetical protein
MLRRFNFKIIVVLAIFFLASCEENSNAQGKSPITLYNMSVRIDPSMNLIEGWTEIQNPGDSCFLIAKGLKIKNIIAGGKNIRFQQTQSQATGNSSEVTIPGGSPDKIVFEYSGRILPDSFPQVISSVNMNKPGLVELSDYIDWYPRSKHYSQFTFKISMDIPSSYITVVNGNLSSQEVKQNRSLEKWESSGPVNRIELFAAPGIKKTRAEKNGLQVEVYYSKLPVSYVDSMKTALLKSMELLTKMYGSEGSSKLVRLIYSPRSAGGYARAPLIFVSENYALEQRSHKYGMARDFRLNTHEIAHYWSRANTNSPDDWINEGLAEFSALWVSREIIGDDFYTILFNEYIDIINNTPAESSILETTSQSSNREVNRYYRPTILLDDLRKKYGDEKMKQFISSLYSHFKQSGSATTNVFLEEIESNYGREVKDSFSKALYLKDWNTNNIKEDIFSAPSDTVLAGKWIGPLTQFGSTTSFVMNLEVKDGKLIPSLDSPDQNVMGIPVTDFKISGDSISYKIGVASAYFRGIIDRNRKVINGVFTQRGDNYHLDLYKKEVK